MLLREKMTLSELYGLEPFLGCLEAYWRTPSHS